MMARPGGELAIAHLPQCPAQSRLADHDPELLEQPLRQVGEAPADHTVDCR